MTALILHHYEMSPFSEKVRRILAWKRLPYQAVRAPAVMPKPDLLALTGGYRKIPVLQQGNHVHCDTSLIARVLEALAPEPTLYPTPLAQIFAEWADSTLFEVTVPIALRPTRLDDVLRWLTQEELHSFADDRRALGHDARRLPPPAKLAKSHLATYFARLDAALSRSPYLLGDAPCIADFAAYHSVWFVSSLAPEVVAPYAALVAWRERIAAFEPAEITAISSSQALAIAAQSSSEWQPAEAFADPLGLSQGQPVTVRALDYGRDPVAGQLVSSTADEVVLRRQDERAGVVYVHFPRIGYEISAVK